MAFDVYPAPQTAPLSVAGGATSALVSITERAAVDPVTMLQTMWIRLVMLGPPCSLPPAVTPTVQLTASGGTQLAVPAHPAPFAEVRDGSNELVANAKMWAEADGVYRVQVIFVTENTGHTWQFGIQNNDAVAHGFTWVVADVDAESRQPWIHVSGTLDFDDGGRTLLVGQQDQRDLVVSNLGTGTLEVSAATGQLGGSDFEVLVAPGDILPNHCGNLTVAHNAPDVPGPSTPHAFVIQSNDTTALSDAASDHNREVTLTGSAGRLEVVVLADASGSMGWRPDGSPSVSPNDRRWDKMLEATEEFLDVLGVFAGDRGRFGIAIFPDPTAVGASSDDVHLPSDITAAQIDGAKASLAAVNPNGGTPMGHGIQRVIDNTPGDFGYFLGTAAPGDDDVTFNERWVVLMSDGAHNQGPPAPSQFLSGGSFPSFSSKNVRAITVAYGDPGAADVDHATLTTIATDSGGVALNAGANDNDIAGLREGFIKAVETTLRLDAVADPVAVLTPSTPERRHPVPVLPYDRRMAFIVNWSSYTEGRVRIQLLTPDCQVLTPASAAQTPGVRYTQGRRYGIFSIEESYIRNSADPERPRHGTWTLIVSGVGLESESETYEWQVLTDSRLKLDVQLDRATYYAGDTLGVTARPTLNGRPLAGASVNLEITRPGQFLGNFLATEAVTQRQFQVAQRQFGENPDIGVLGIKTHALRSRGVNFLPFNSKTTVAMQDEAGAGSYAASVSGTATPGHYELYITATGTTEDGWLFRREKKVQLYLDVRPAVDWTIFDLSWLREAQHRFESVVRVQLRDVFGNYLVFPSNADPRINFNLRGAELSGIPVINLDGSISQNIMHPPNSTPQVSLSLADRPFEGSFKVPSHAGLVFADRVVDFQAGAEARDGINEHRDPTHLLGDILRRDQGVYTALGAGGAVTVGLEGRTLRAQGDDDITVFVQPLAEPRGYAVEARAVGSDRWVRLGTSAGETHSFSLRRAGLRTAESVRIVDLSGAVVDRSFQPSDSPGVAIQGVAFRPAREGVAGLLVDDIDGIANRFDSVLMQRGVVSVVALAEADLDSLQVDIPPGKLRELVEKARIAISAASEVPDVPALSRTTIWEIVSTPPEELARSVNASRPEVERVQSALAVLQVALDDAALRRLTLQDLRESAGPGR